MAHPDELARFVRRPDGSLAAGRTLPGRGGWLCRGSVACFDTAVKRRAFGRSLRASVDSGAVERLRIELLGRPSPIN